MRPLQCRKIVELQLPERYCSDERSAAGVGLNRIVRLLNDPPADIGHDLAPHIRLRSAAGGDDDFARLADKPQLEKKGK